MVDFENFEKNNIREEDIYVFQLILSMHINSLGTSVKHMTIIIFLFSYKIKKFAQGRHKLDHKEVNNCF